MLHFDVVAEISVPLDTLAGDDEIPRIAEPIDATVTRYRDRGRRADAAKKMPGFQGFSMRPGCDVVIDGVHQPLTPRLFKED